MLDENYTISYVNQLHTLYLDILTNYSLFGHIGRFILNQL